MAGRPEQLFYEENLYSVLDAARKRAAEEVDAYDPDQLLAQAEDDIIAYLVDKLHSEAPVLRLGDMYVDFAGETKIDVSRRVEYNVLNRSRPAYTAGTRVEVVLPFDGDPTLFRYKPSTFTYNPPRAIVETGALRLVFEDVRLDAAGLKSEIDREVGEITKWVGWVHDMTDPYDAELPGFVAARLRQRKDRILANRGLVANLGIPVRTRDDPGTFRVPVHRRRVRLPPAQVSKPFAPEPAFAAEDFEAAIQLLHGSRNMLERSPSTTSQLGEEDIRNLLLVALNGHFEGDAGGELFNGKGKTDILIRRGDRNVFIGECKFWKGPKGFGEAIDQLLGYVVWRDAKAALLLFIRQPNVTDIVAKATAALAAHPRCKRDHGGNEERHDYVLHAEGDPSCELHLVLLPFALPRPDHAES